MPLCMLDKTQWIVLNNDSPGYLGMNRDAFLQTMNEKYGEGNWQIAWLVEDNFLNFLEVCQHYEEAYYQYLLNNPEILNQLITEAADVYDTDPGNIKSGLDYSVQDGKNNHIQDIAIRNCLKRLGFRISR